MMKKLFAVALVLVVLALAVIPCFALYPEPPEVSPAVFITSATNWIYVPSGVTGGHYASPATLNYATQLINLQWKYGSFGSYYPLLLTTVNYMGSAYQTMWLYMAPLLPNTSTYYWRYDSVLDQYQLCYEDAQGNVVDVDSLSCFAFAMSYNGFSMTDTPTQYTLSGEIGSVQLPMCLKLDSTISGGFSENPRFLRSGVLVSDYLEDAYDYWSLWSDYGIVEVETVIVTETETVIVPTEIVETLDVGSVITSLPEAAKTFFDETFGFELFGLNVAGTLSTILVIAIIGFIVRRFLSK